MPEQVVANFAIGALVVLGVIFLAVGVGFAVRYFVLSTREQMCTMDRKETRNIARDEAVSEFNNRIRVMDKKQSQLNATIEIIKKTSTSTAAE